MHPLDKFKYCPVCGADNFTENDDKSKKCHKCGFRYYLNAVSAVAGFIVDDNNQCLLPAYGVRRYSRRATCRRLC